jgi:hypothetical protein
MPEPASVAVSVTETAVEYQPVEQTPPPHAAVVVGATPSPVTVNGVVAVRPAPFVAVTLLFGPGSTADAAKL